MNVMLFSKIIAKTGVGNHIKTLSRELVRQGHKVVVVSSSNDINVGGKDIIVEMLPIRSKNPMRILKNVKSLHNIIKNNNIEIVHCHHRMAALYMKLYRMIWHIPVVYTLHLANIPADFIHRAFTYVGDVAIAVSTEVNNYLVDKLGVSSKKVITVLNGIEDPCDGVMPAKTQISNLKQKWNIAEDKIVISMHSRIDAVKNHMLMVEAINRLSELAKKRVVVVCSGEKQGEYYEKVIKQISQYGIEDNFRFVGWIATKDIYSVSDFMVMPSINEGFGLNVSEAFFMKIPVARTRTAGFEDQKYCLPISDNDPGDIVKIIEDLCANGTKQYNERIEKAYQYATNELTVEKMTKNTVEIYKKVCRK